MPHWCLSLPPPAAPTLPSRLHRSSSPIAVDSPSPRPLMPSIAIHRSPSPSIAMPSITDKSPSRRPYPSITIAIAVHRRRASAGDEPSHHPSPSTSRRAVHCRRAAPSITVEEPSIAVNPSTAFKSLSLRPLMPIAVESLLCRPSSSHRAIHHR